MSNRAGFPLALLLAIGMALPGFAQEARPRNAVVRYFDRMLGEQEDPTAPKFVHYPTLAFTPETSWEFGLSSLYVYSANRDSSNRLSEIKAFTFYTLERQYGMALDHALYTHQNRWFFYGRAGYQNFPLFYYGIGRDSPSDGPTLIDGQYFLLRERILRETLPSLYMGLELDIQTLNGVRYVPSTDTRIPLVPEVGTDGSNHVGLGLGVVYNDIHNALNPRKGRHSEWAFLRYGAVLERSHSFTSFITDNRLFHPVGKAGVLAAQLYGEFTFGQPTFNMLALMGGQSLMRGFYRGRYRDQHLVAGQVELRMLPFPFSKRLGGAVFMAGGQVFGDERRLDARQFQPAGGAGLRFLLFPDKDIYTRVDVAYTREGRGVYIAIGEAF